MKSIEPTLAKLRGLTLDSDIPAELQPPADFRAHVHAAVGAQNPHANDRATALVALGLLPPATNLAKSIEDANMSQIAAYYEPTAKKFFLVMVPESETTLDMLSAHELTHGLQDQHFGLVRYLSRTDPGGPPDSDAETARRFVVEGDAMLSMIVYGMHAQYNVDKLESAQVGALQTYLERFASKDFSATVAAMQQQARVSPDMDPELKKAIDEMGSIPRTILVPLMDSYMRGALTMLAVYEHGGWDAINDLYRNPPESTEQMLHPDKRLIAKRDRPRRVTLPTLDGYELVSSDVLGELQWSVYFSLWKHAGDGNEEENWGGDRYAVLRRQDGKLTVLIATIWDSEYDAKIFYDAYLSTLATRFPDGKPKDDGTDNRLHGDRIWVRRHGDRVFVVDGGNHELMDTLAATTTFE